MDCMHLNIISPMQQPHKGQSPSHARCTTTSCHKTILSCFVFASAIHYQCFCIQSTCFQFCRFNNLNFHYYYNPNIRQQISFCYFVTKYKWRVLSFLSKKKKRKYSLICLLLSCEVLREWGQSNVTLPGSSGSMDSVCQSSAELKERNYMGLSDLFSRG